MSGSYCSLIGRTDAILTPLHHSSQSMGQDVHQIEVRNKGMQIASANQKLLLAEVDKLLVSNSALCFTKVYVGSECASQIAE